MPCAPSNRIRLPSRRISSSFAQTASENGNIWGATSANCFITSAAKYSGWPRPRRRALWWANMRSILGPKVERSAKSFTRIARLPTLSSYAGPMPRPVVPILPAPAASSRILSSSLCSGKISVALPAMRKFSRLIETPCLVSFSISAINAQGSITTPLPIIDNLPGRKMPEGKSDNL